MTLEVCSRTFQGISVHSGSAYLIFKAMDLHIGGGGS